MLHRYLLAGIALVLTLRAAQVLDHEPSPQLSEATESRTEQLPSLDPNTIDLSTPPTIESAAPATSTWNHRCNDATTTIDSLSSLLESMTPKLAPATTTITTQTALAESDEQSQETNINKKTNHSHHVVTLNGRPQHESVVPTTSGWLQAWIDEFARNASAPAKVDAVEPRNALVKVSAVEPTAPAKEGDAVEPAFQIIMTVVALLIWYKVLMDVRDLFATTCNIVQRHMTLCLARHKTESDIKRGLIISSSLFSSPVTIPGRRWLNNLSLELKDAVATAQVAIERRESRRQAKAYQKALAYGELPECVMDETDFLNSIDDELPSGYHKVLVPAATRFIDDVLVKFDEEIQKLP